MQRQEDKGEQILIYNFIVLTNANLYSIQTEIDVEKLTNTKVGNPIDIKKQYVKKSKEKSKTNQIQFDDQFGLYSCFK